MSIGVCQRLRFKRWEARVQAFDLRGKVPVMRPPINEPLADWEPLEKAPGYCFSNRYIHSDKKWKDAAAQEIREISQSLMLADTELIDARGVEWVVKNPRESFSINLKATGLSSFILPGGAMVSLERFSELPEDRFLICVRPGGSDRDWDSIPPHIQLAAKWHRAVLDRLFSSWHSSFSKALARGQAVIMARSGSVLAPFERITWDQWQFFR
jgi:hypothetical protein